MEPGKDYDNAVVYRGFRIWLNPYPIVADALVCFKHELTYTEYVATIDEARRRIDILCGPKSDNRLTYATLGLALVVFWSLVVWWWFA